MIPRHCIESPDTSLKKVARLWQGQLCMWLQASLTLLNTINNHNTINVKRHLGRSGGKTQEKKFPQSNWCFFASQVSIYSSAGKTVVWRGQRLRLPLSPWLQPPMPPQMLWTNVHPLHAGTTKASTRSWVGLLTVLLISICFVFFLIFPRRWCGQHPTKWAVPSTPARTWTCGGQCGNGRRT